MDSIPQKELRNQVGEILRRVGAGESLTVTVAGRPVAELHPAAGRRWVGGKALEAVWRGPALAGFEEDLEGLHGLVLDPFQP